jgi:hypothetical protein
VRTFKVHEYVDGDLKVYVKEGDNTWQKVGTIPWKHRDLALAQLADAVQWKMKTTLTDEETKALLQELAWPRRW